MSSLQHESYAPPESHLSVVINDTTTYLAQRQAAPKMPAFEGLPVIGSAGKIMSVRALDLAGAVYKVDEIVKVVVEVEVTGVHHDVDHESGRLVRVHRLKAKKAVVVEWDFDIESLLGGTDGLK